MTKAVKIILVILGVAVMWGVLASINAGVIGLGVILSVLAILDVATAEFKGSNKMVWLAIGLAALFLAVIGIGSLYAQFPTATGGNSIYSISALVSIFLPLAYFIFGRRQKTTRDG